MLKYFTRNKKLVHYIITVAFIFGFRYIPPFDPITAYGMGIIGVFIGTVYGWTTINMGWPSIVGLIGLGSMIGMENVLAVSFGNPIIAMMFILLPVMAILNETQATDLIASVFMTNRLTQGKPWLLVLFMFLGTWVCVLINPFIAIIMFMTFVKQVCEIAGIPLRSPFTATMTIGIALATLMGQIMFPFFGTGLNYTATFTAMTGSSLPYVQYIAFMIPMQIVLLAVYVLVMRFVFRIDVKKLKDITPETLGGKKKATVEQKMALGLLGIVITVLLGVSFLPHSWALIQQLAKLTIFGQVTIIAIIAMILVKEDGQPFLDFTKLASKGMAWDVVFLTAFIMPVSTLMVGEDTGVILFLGKMLAPLIALPPVLFIITVVVFAAFVTNFANNFVIGVIIMPVICTYAANAGIEPFGMILVLMIATQFALATPGASPLTGICYSYSDIVEAPMMIKYSILTLIMLLGFVILVGIPYSSLLF